MNWPPMLMHVKIKNEKSDFGLWLPLFLLFPLALVVLLVFSPLILIAMLILLGLGQGRWVKWGFRCLWVAITSSWALRGLKVDVRGRNDEVVQVTVV
jgi:Na+-driven multidrug efflux pump